MTEDTSPENLRKFLESDDPAMRRMGLSMAKGSGVPEELHLTLLGILLWDSEEGNRGVAKDLVDGIGIQIPSYPVVIGMMADARAVEPLIKALEGDWNLSQCTAEALGEIGDARAVEPLIKALPRRSGGTYGDGWGNRYVPYALEMIGDVRAVGPLIEELCRGEELLEDDSTEPSHCSQMQYYHTFVPNALARIGESMRAKGVSGDREWIEQLIENLNYGGFPFSAMTIRFDQVPQRHSGNLVIIVPWSRSGTAHTLSGDSRLLKIPIGMLPRAAKEALRKLGHEVE